MGIKTGAKKIKGTSKQCFGKLTRNKKLVLSGEKDKQEANYIKKIKKLERKVKKG